MKTVIELPDMEKKGGTDAECLLTVTGDTTLLNTFDKAFRSGIGPQWADRPSSSVPHYSLHALCSRCRRRSSAAGFPQRATSGVKATGKRKEICGICR